MRSGLNTGDSAWVLVSFAMVLLMTPGLALFYGGMVRARNLVSVLYMSFVSIAVVTVIWFLYGYGLAFGDDVGGAGLIGWGRWQFLKTTPSVLRGVIPEYVFSMFQLVFAIITLALISGSVANRVRLGPWMVFGLVWVTLVYLPIAHWVFSKGAGSTGGARWTSPAAWSSSSTPASRAWRWRWCSDRGCASAGRALPSRRTSRW